MIGWIIAAVFVLAALAAITFEAIHAPKRRREAAERDRLRLEEVERRRWRLEVERQPRGVKHRYSGSNGSVAWICETESWSAGTRSHSQQRTRTRWSTDAVRARSGILVIWPSFGAGPQQTGADVPQFVLNLILSPLINALGPDAPEAGQLSTAVPVDDSVLRNFYLLRATEPAAMKRFLDAGARDHLAAAAPWLASRSLDNHLIIAVISDRGLTILLSGWVDDIEHIARLADLGTALADAHRFS